MNKIKAEISGRWNTLSLSAKTSAGILTLLIILFGITGYFLLSYFTSTMIKNAEGRVNDLASLFAKINSLPLEWTDYYALENSSQEMLKTEGVVIAEIYDTEYFKVTSVEKKDVKKSDNIYYKQNVIYGKYGNIIGYAKVGLSLDNTYERIQKVALVLILVLAASLIATAYTITFLIRQIVNRPLNNLLESVNIVAMGDLSHRMNIMAQDEIGKLSLNFNDMTERLRSSQNLINNIFESMPSVLISIDKNGLVTQWNNGAEKFTGISRIDILDKNLWASSNHFNEYRSQIESVLISGSHEQLYRIRFSTFPDAIKNLSVYPLSGSEITGAVIRIDDITDLEIKDAQLIQMQKMEVIGSMTGGIAHDFNNILGGIIGTVSVLKYSISKGKQLSEEEILNKVNIIESTANRAANVVKQLMSLSRKNDYNPVAVDINESIGNVIVLCRNSFDKSIEIIYNPYSNPVLIEADPTQIEQLLLNICINAEHAMTIMRGEKEQYGGKLSVDIKVIDVDKHFINQHPDAKESVYTQIIISDSGIGMDQKTVARIFDPFFTTKDKTKGTGLGLSMVYNIVHSHNGFIDVFSEPDVGTSFNLFFPLSGKSENISAVREDMIMKGHGKILIIDDEDIIRKTAEEILKESGYSVIAVDNGLNGLEIYQQNPEDISLILIDMAMPVINGRDTYIELKKINPEVKVIMASGYKQDKRVLECIEMGINCFIQKPYTMSELSNAVYKVLFESPDDMCS